jgi:hypothetical protein
MKLPCLVFTISPGNAYPAIGAKEADDGASRFTAVRLASSRPQKVPR